MTTPAEGEHDWEQVGWEYDDSFFKCRRCHRRTNCRRGYPASTVKECKDRNVPACDGPSRWQRLASEEAI